MNGIDYSKKISQVKDDYYKRANQLKSSYEQDIDNLKKTHDVREEKMGTTHRKNIRNLEKENKDIADIQNKKVTEILDRSQEDYNKRVQTEQKQFASDRKKLKLDFDEKLRNTADSFRKSAEESRKNHKGNVESIKLRNDDIRKRETLQNHKNINSLSEKSKKDLTISRDRSARERKKLLNDFRVDKQGLVASSSRKRDALLSKKQGEISNLRELHEGESKRSNLRHDELIDNIRLRNDDSSKNLVKEYNEISKNLQDKFSQESKRANHEQKSLRTGLRKESEGDIRELRRKNYNLATNFDIEEKHGAQIEAINKNNDGRLQNIKNQMDNLKQQHQLDKDRALDNFQENSNEQSDANKSSIDELKFNTSKNIRSMNQRFSDQKNKVVGQYKKEINDQRLQTEQSAFSSKKKHDISLANQRDNFNHTINTLSDKNVETVKAIQSELSREKTNAIEEVRKRSHNERIDLKDEMRRSFSNKESGYIQVIDDAKKENKRVKEYYENKISTLQDKNNKEMRVYKSYVADKDISDKRAAKRSLEVKEEQFTKKFIRQQSDYNRKIADTKNHNDIHVNKLVNRYEDQIERLTIDKNKEIKNKLGDMQRKYDRIIKLDEIEKESIVNKYELKLEKLRLANKTAREVSERRS